MGFFDLNIPYAEPSPADKATLERQRTKIVVKAMELGYTGIAYNRTIKGVMSDHHRCSIPCLTLSPLLKVAPSLSLSIKLHRDLLGIPSAAPFRQYMRLTVCVDNSLHSQALNSGNPIMKTYDLVAVRPLNQTAFDQACEGMEVDIISIDFSDKLPFRLKQSMVKAAAERGVFFEIIYSGLITDTQIRRQLICNAKLLVDWTRGRNIILSSAACSVNELRGPYDVANLSLLLGLSEEGAKAAISKNCRTLLANSLRKKKYYKEAIRVEVVPSGAASNSKEPWHKELLKWDPISNGEGDLLLDDMAKSFSFSCKATKTTKAFDFASVIDNIQAVSCNNLPLKTCTGVTSEAFKFTEEIKTPTSDTKLELKCVDYLDENCIHLKTNAHEYQSDKCISNSALDGIIPDENEKLDTSSADVKLEGAHNIDGRLKMFTQSMEIDFPAPIYDQHKNEISSDVNLNAQIAKRHEALSKEDTKIGELMILKEMNQAISENLMADEQSRKHESEAVELGEMPQKTSHEIKMEDDCSTATRITTDVTMEDHKHAEGCIDSHQLAMVKSISGKPRVKRGTTGGIHLSPFKRLLNPIPFKKKAQKIKSRTKMR